MPLGRAVENSVASSSAPVEKAPAREPFCIQAGDRRELGRAEDKKTSGWMFFYRKATEHLNEQGKRQRPRRV